MATQIPISGLGSLAVPASGDLLVIVDISDTPPATGNTKNITYANLIAGFSAVTFPAVVFGAAPTVTMANANLQLNATTGTPQLGFQSAAVSLASLASPSSDHLEVLDHSGSPGGTLSAATFVGALSGNASTATALQTARQIAGAPFDGTAPINIDANNLSGTTLNAGIVTSSLTTVGALGAGSIGGSFGAINIGTNALTAGVTTLGSSDGTGKIEPTTFSLANNGTKTVIAGTATTRGWALITSSVNAVGGLFTAVTGAGCALAISNAAFTATLGSAGTTNFQSATNTFTLENKTGGTVTYSFLFIGIP
jgi:hypothetical protein